MFSKAPCNLFPTPIIRTDNISWLYQALADSWINTLGLPNDTRETILRGGFYTTLIRPEKNEVVILADTFYVVQGGNNWFYDSEILLIPVTPEDYVIWNQLFPPCSSWYNGYNMLKITKKRFTLSPIIHLVRVLQLSVGILIGSLIGEKLKNMR
jgi:hypothetical protein